MASSSAMSGGVAQSQGTQPFYAQLPPISVKLTDGNFLMWQQQVDVTAYGYGLEGFLNGERRPPPQLILTTEEEGGSVVNEEFVSWQRQDRRVAAWLLSSLSEGALGLVVGLRSARDIWNALETNFASRSTAKIMQYRQQMQNLKKDSLTMSEYVGKMRNYFDLLGSVGCRIFEDEQVLHILGGLGQEYDPAVCAISSRSDSWSLGDATAFLLTFESRMESSRTHSSSTEGSQPALNLVQQATQKRDYTPYGSRFDSGGGRGGSRNQRGGRGGRSFGRGNVKVVCQLCDKPGHTAAKCWHRFEQHYAPPLSQLRGNGLTQQQQQGSFNPAAHLVQTSAPRPSASFSADTSSEFGFDSSSSTNWYPDSGATHHVSGDLSNLNVSSEYTGGSGNQGGRAQGNF